jgi:hypothetical protein
MRIIYVCKTCGYGAAEPDWTDMSETITVDGRAELTHAHRPVCSRCGGDCVVEYAPVDEYGRVQS